MHFISLRFISSVLTRRKLFIHSGVRNKHMNLSGIFPPILTPFNRDETIAYDKLAQNFNKWNKIPFRGYLVQGTNGEFVSLSFEERIEMIRQVRKLVPKEKLLLAGSGCESTKLTIELTNQMAKAGADAVVVITPSFFKNRLTVDSLVHHYTNVADASPIPVILYSVPASTGIDLPVEAIVALSKHHNIIGLKDSGGDVSKIGAVIVQTSSFQVLAGSAGFLLPSYTIGTVGGICALGNVLGEELCKLHYLFVNNELKEAKALQLRLIQPNLAVTKIYGVAGLKAAMELKGYYGGLPRFPLLPPSQAEKKALTNIFRVNGFLGEDKP